MYTLDNLGIRKKASDPYDAMDVGEAVYKTANIYCDCVHQYWEGCVIYSIHLR